MNRMQSMMMRTLLAGCLAAGIAASAGAQISEGGIPPSFRYEQTLRSRAAATTVAVNFNVDDEKLVDAWHESEDQTPRCIGKVINVNMSPENAGAWSTLPDGQTIWQLEIRAEGAQALSLYYADFLIPEGGKLFLYNTDKSQLLGAYTHATNPSGGPFSTEFVAGDAVTLEYVPGSDGRRPRLMIEGVGYGYNLSAGHPVFRPGAKLRGLSGTCQVNVNCSEGSAWQNEKKGICHMEMLNGDKMYICSGSLVNNTAQDMKPYILTASHCAGGSSHGIATDANLLQWRFYFHMEHSDCDGYQPTKTSSMVGCTRLASIPLHGGSDGMLLLLRQNIPESYDVYYNGWDRSEQPASSGVSLHHPKGDRMKISTYTSPAHTAWYHGSDNSVGTENAHWNVIFVRTAHGHSVTEPGSSGSPLFNSNKRIVGTLSGGSSSCTKVEGSNLYGKLSYHWNKYSGVRFDRFLDPTGCGVMTLDGRYFKQAVNPLPPRNLQSALGNGSVRLTWAAPSSGSPRGYRIYRNKTIIGEATTTAYTDASPGTGKIDYSVSAVYADGNESSLISASVTISPTPKPTPSPSNDLKAPINLKVSRSTAAKAALAWDAPFSTREISRSGDRPRNQVNGNDEGESRPFYFGHRWEPSDLASLNKHAITELTFAPTRGNDYEIYITQGSRTYRQRITQTMDEDIANTVTLTTPFVIDGSQVLMVAIFVSRLGNYDLNYPASCDDGPAIDGKGDLYSFDGRTWLRLHDGPEADNFDLNFFLSATVTSGSPTGAEITGYAIYRDGTRIATVPATSTRYVDPTRQTRRVNYQVVTLYGGRQSAPSSSVAFDPTANMELDVTATGFYPNPFGERFYLRNADRVSRIELFSTDGRLLLRQDNPGESIDTHSISAGVCLIRLTLRDGSQETFRGVKR